jgi:hypothetical protein
MRNASKQVSEKYLSKDHILVGFELFTKIEIEKKSRHDIGKHLVIYFKNYEGDMCRTLVSHKNDQSIKIYQDYWFMEGYEYLKGNRPTVNTFEGSCQWSCQSGELEKIEQRG